MEGANLADLSSRDRAKRISLLPQQLPNTELTVFSLVSLGRLSYTGALGSLSDIDRQKISHALNLTNMTDLADRPCNTLSGGEKQRAFLAMLLAQDADLLLLDEPTAFLDIDAANGLYQILSDLVQNHGKTVLAVLHDLSAAVNLADDVAVLENGALRFFGSVEDCIASRAIESAFSVTAHTVDGKIFFD